MYEFWYNYLKPKYREKLKLCYMDTESYTIYIKTEDIYSNIAKDTKFDTWNYHLDGPSPTEKNKK